MNDISVAAKSISEKINWFVERLCVAFLVILVLDVWLGILARYVIPLPLTFTEELARYLMIWMALLAVSCGIAHREHIGVEAIFTRFPPTVRRYLAVAFDIIGIAFFGVLLVYGLGFTARGMNRVTMIYGTPRGYFFAGVPLAAAFACLQLGLMAVHDWFADRAPETTGSSATDDERLL